MPWPEGHKAQTRQRIVEAAAAAFRAGGVAGVRLEDVMARAGLTHGGFYAHFSSKDELLRAALEHAGEQTIEMLSKPLADAPAEHRLQSVIDAYLSPAHVAHPEWGCPLATLGPEIARATRPTPESFAKSVKDRVRWMRQLQPAGQSAAEFEPGAVGALACMIGGVILARTVPAKDSDTVLKACRAFLRQCAARTAKPGRASRTRTRRTRTTAKQSYRLK